MSKSILISILLTISVTIFAQSPVGKRYKKIKLDTSYNHTKYITEPSDIIFKFAAYTVSFDSADDNNGDGESDIWAIPEWVSYEIKGNVNVVRNSYRPSKWMTDDSLRVQGIAPDDDSYKVQRVNKLREVKIDYRFVRGHMCPKNVADRISKEAGYNTCTVLNAVPQIQWQNNGIWKCLEKQIINWADKYGRVWVICGGVFFDKTPSVWIGQGDEVKVAVPDALYKIVIRESETGIKTLTFIIPNIIPKEKYCFYEYLTSMKRLEQLTGLTFLTNLPKRQQKKIKKKHYNLPFKERQDIVENF